MNSNIPNRRRLRSGFTLVEMLVAVSLVALIMLLLAQVFSLAANTARKQKGTAENDQQARTFTTIIQGDICARSYRKMIPFRPIGAGDDINTFFPDADGDGLELRRGYFQISENNPDSQKDDVLSFTVDYQQALVNDYCVYDEENGVRGAALILGTDSDAYLANNPNQPEHDDGYPFRNSSGLSKYAEVCYFLRNGNLHRRVMLLRDQYSNDASTNGQPTNIATNELITGSYPGAYSPQGSLSFWRDFDYSAIFSNASTPNKPFFLVAAGADVSVNAPALDNSSAAGTFQYDFGGGAVAVPLNLGIPHFRFGHDITDGSLGRAREFLNAYRWEPSSPTTAMAEQNFLGRFTVQETAFVDTGTPANSFTYPGSLVGGNPMDPGTITLADSDRNGVVDRYDGIDRRGDDILLTNVLEFDVKVWDPVLRAFVDLGHSARSGTTPIGYFNITRNQSFDDSVGSTPGVLEYSYNATTQKFDLQEPLLYGNTFDTWHWFDGLGAPPYRPLTEGVDLEPGDATANDDGDGNTNEADETGWIGTDDEIALKAIQITIRFTDPLSGLVRQVTLQESLVDE